MGGRARHLYVPTRFSDRGPTRFHSADPTELLAAVVRAKREVLLRAHHHRLRRDDLEDCYGQATFELLRCMQRGGHFVDREHIANVLEQRFLSRVRDELRATRGRSAERTAHEGALAHPVGTGAGIDVEDLHADVHERVARTLELEQVVRVAHRLSSEQRLVLASQVHGVGCAELCRHTGWSAEKYRKVAQRGRARLRELTAESAAAPARGPLSRPLSRSASPGRSRA